tara:strand:+ start:587 stop:1147 length:561 start_codon:yes stop_codon:yes gene_type:complete
MTDLNYSKLGVRRLIRLKGASPAMAAIALLVCSFLSLKAEEQRLPGSHGTVNLPEGYEYVPQQGIDSIVGLFQRKEAMVSFDLGPMAGVYADTTRLRFKGDETVTVIRNRGAKIDGRKVEIFVYSRGGANRAIVSYPNTLANFFCEYQNEGDLVDFLLLALSYKPAPKQAEPDEQSIPAPAPSTAP